jgi:hyperosmotically inducible protein
MDSQKSRKIIVASGMAAAVGILAVIFALRTHHDTLVAQAPHPPTPIAEVPAASAAVAQTPDMPPAVAQAPDAPAAVAHSEIVGTKSADVAAPSAVEPKLARNRHLEKADTSAVATTDTGTRTGSAAKTSEKPAADTAGNSADRVKAAEGSTTTPASSSSPADNQKVGTSTEFASSDSQITTDVKSQLAGDTLSKDATIGVTTTHGVVALTGTLASQNAIDHAKDVAGKVKDVKSVDASALVLASL